MTDRPISISLYPPHEDGRPTHETGRAIRQETTVKDLVQGMCEHESSPAKHLASAWSPITYLGAARKGSEASGVCALVYDLDHCDPLNTASPAPTQEQLESLSSALEARGWIYAIHETWTRGRYRLVLPTSRELTPREYPAVYAATLAALGSPPVDRAAGDLARLFYAPSVPDGETRFSCKGGTKLLDPSEFAELRDRTAKPAKLLDSAKSMKSLGASQPQAPGKTENAPENHSPKIFDLQKLRAEIEARNDDKRGDLLALIDGTLRVPPGGRETLLHPLLGALAWCRNAPPEGVAEAMFERILSARENAEEYLEGWVKKAMYSYTRAEDMKSTRDQEVALVEKFFRDETWRSELKQIVDPKGAVKGLTPCEHNLRLVLQRDAAFEGHIRWNLLKQKMEVLGGALKDVHENARDDLGVPLAAWFQSSEYNCMTSRELAGACLQHVALSNGYDPVKEWFGTLPAWDGEKRLATLLLKYANASGAEDWIRVITRKFFIAAVARALDPGCQVDNVLVLQGKQGGGKTSFVRVMGCGFHVETSLDLHNKDAVMTAAGNWLVELGELASLKKSDVESVRNFITRREDQIRLPYGKVIKTMPRRCIFIGTTNSRQPLTDPEGNRRFWVVSVGKVDTEGLEKVRLQLWAEALQAYRAGEPWWLTQAESVRAEREARVYEADDVTESEILAYLEKATKWPEYLTATEVATKILCRVSGHMTSQEMAAINRTMSNMGWEKTRRRNLGRTVTAYLVPSRKAMEAQGERLDSEN
jgi:predicted P-loop ATPase